MRRYYPAVRAFGLLLPLFACLPFLLHLKISFTDAYFETVSGLTATGATVLSGLDIITAFSAVVASINNTGPGLSLVGPTTTFAVLTNFQTWICAFAMLLGRLEIFTLLVVLTPAFWRR